MHNRVDTAIEYSAVQGDRGNKASTCEYSCERNKRIVYHSTNQLWMAPHGLRPPPVRTNEGMAGAQPPLKKVRPFDVHHVCLSVCGQPIWPVGAIMGALFRGARCPE
eukprot:7098205-Pyramimonas_sp.AAC.1